jgi:hypothetical protein
MNGSEQQDAKRLAARQFSHGLGERQSVQVGRLEIENRSIKGSVVLKPFKCLMGGRYSGGLHPEYLKPPRQDPPICVVIFDDQHTTACKIGTSNVPGNRMAVQKRLDLNREMEGAPILPFALYPHPAAHELCEALADNQAKTGASELPRCRTVDLAEGFEEAVLFVLGNANARVPHREVQRLPWSVRFRPLGLDDYLALARELDSISHKIYQDLPESGDIPDQRNRHRAVQLVGKV